MAYQNCKSRSFQVRRGVPQGSILDPALFSLLIDDLPASLPSSASCSLYADDLAIWFSFPSVPTAVKATQGSLIRLERWSEYWCLPLNPSKCEATFFLVDSHQANFQPHFHLFNSRLRFNPTPTFLGVTFDSTFSFFKHGSSLKAKFLPRLKALRCISASSWDPCKKSLFCIKLFFTYASSGWFPFLPLLRVTLTHFALSPYERALRLPTSFPILNLARLGMKPRLCRSSWRAVVSTHPLMLPSISPREALLAYLSLFLGICLPLL